MGQCVWCGSKSIFLSVDKNSLCSKCRSLINFDLQQRLRIIEESQEIIKKTSNFKTLLHRIDTILEHLQALRTYEEKNISTITPSPSEFEKILLHKKDELINDNIVQEVGKIMNKARLGLTAKSKINEANKAILLITEKRNELKSQEKISNFRTHDIRLKKLLFNQAFIVSFLLQKAKFLCHWEQEPSFD